MKTIVYFNIRVADEGLTQDILATEMGISFGESYAAMEEKGQSEKSSSLDESHVVMPQETEMV